MTRFVVSTCGVITEVAAMDALAPGWMLVATGATLGVAVVAWWSAAGPVIDRIIGIDG